MATAQVVPIVRQEVIEAALDRIRQAAESAQVDAQIIEETIADSVLDLERAQAEQLAPTGNRVRSQKTFDQAWEALRSVQWMKARLDEVFGPAQDAAYALHKRILHGRSLVWKPLDELKAKLVSEASDFYLECERRWREQHGQAVPGAITPTTLEKPKGGSIRKEYTYEITNFDQFAAWAMRKKNINLLTVNDKALKSHVKHGVAAEIPGVTVKPVAVVSVQKWKEA